MSQVSHSYKKSIHYHPTDTVISILLSILFIRTIEYLSFYDDTATLYVPQIVRIVNWHAIAPLFVVTITIGLVNHIVRIFIKEICLTNTILTMITSVTQTILAYIIIKQLNFWDYGFIYSFYNDPDYHYVLNNLLHTSTTIENALLIVIAGINVAIFLDAFLTHYKRG